jgi:hypothetical protein
MKRWLSLIAVSACLSLGLSAGAQQAQYTLTNIADSQSGSRFYDFGGATSINRDNVVAFAAADMVAGYGIYWGDGVSLGTLSATIFSYFDGYVSNNDAGDIAFPATLRAGGRGIFVGGTGALVTVAQTGSEFLSVGRWPRINNTGNVAFAGVRTTGARGVYVYEGGSLSTRADNSGAFSDFSDPAISDSGTVAFRAQLKDGSYGVFTTSPSGAVQKIADTTGDSPFWFFGPNVAINSSGTVAFKAQLKDNSTGIFVATGTTVAKLADTSAGSPYTNFGDNLAINTGGEVVFRASLAGGGHGLFTGPDPLRHKVAATGDVVAGSTLTYLDFPSINEHGAVSFYANYQNWTAGVVRADVYVAPPVISNVTVTNVTQNSATITWTTNVASSTLVEYGTTAAYGSAAAGPAGVSTHTVALTGLTENTTYHFRVRSANSGGTAISADTTFTTKAPAPSSIVISDVRVSEITTTSAVITWTTNVPAYGNLQYRRVGAGLNTLVEGDALTTSHRIALTDLRPDTEYSFRVSAQADGAYATTPNYTFRTALIRPIITGTDPGMYIKAQAPFTFRLYGRGFAPDSKVWWTVFGHAEPCPVQYVSSTELIVTSPLFSGAATNAEFVQLTVTGSTGDSKPYKFKARPEALRAEVVDGYHSAKGEATVAFVLKNISDKPVSKLTLTSVSLSPRGMLWYIMNWKTDTLQPGETTEPIYAAFLGTIDSVHHVTLGLGVKYEGGEFYASLPAKLR